MGKQVYHLLLYKNYPQRVASNTVIISHSGLGIQKWVLVEVLKKVSSGCHPKV